jgi:hypothetical protein
MGMRCRWWTPPPPRTHQRRCWSLGGTHPRFVNGRLSSSRTTQPVWPFGMKPKTKKREVRRMIRQQSAWITLNGVATTECQIMDISKRGDHPWRVIRCASSLRTCIDSGRSKATDLRSDLAPRQDVGDQIHRLANGIVFHRCRRAATGPMSYEVPMRTNNRRPIIMIEP